ncbi:MAG: HEAT repeat domain-containing protein [Bacillota bacterium]
MIHTRMTLTLVGLLLAQGSIALAQATPAAQTGTGDPYQAIVKREFGMNGPELAAIEKEIHDARPEGYPAIEAKLLTVLHSPDATAPAKQFVCQMLRTVGSAQCVPAVSRLLIDEKLSHIARNVFQGMHDPAVDTALRAALGQTQGNVRIGLINTLGDRGDAQALEALSALVGADEATARVALNAMGRIGGAAAADMLEKAKVADSLKDAWANADLRCAQSLISTDPARSERMLQGLVDGDYPRPVRAAAFVAVAALQKERAVPLVVKTLRSEDNLMWQAAATAIVQIPGNAATRAFVQELGALPSDRKPALLVALAARGDADGATEAVNKLATDEDPAVREAAINALARLGNAASVPLLAAGFKEGGRAAADATRVLTDLLAPGVNEALVKEAEAGAAVIREGVLNVLAHRGQADALPVVRKATTDSDASVRRAAIKTLGVLGTQEDVGKLVAALLATQDNADRGVLATAISSISLRQTDKATRAQPVVQAMNKADAKAKVSLLGILATLGGDQALRVIKASLADDTEVHKTAVRALSEWKDAAPMGDLLTIAREDKDTANQILALRGYIRMAGIEGSQADAKLAAYRQAMELATRPDEKRLVLAGLGDVPHTDALKTVEPCLDDATLRREAFAAYVKIAEAIAGSEPSVAKEALKTVQEKAPDPRMRARAKSALEKVN